ncbi:PLC-like phosphodiesterase [Pleomassaria siparia CBS 279.74]|uniref:PLC-like phosphodiesterase n=1 Tax=Pleomassaria siparia CBS 279.74 TaxID=1314801 RepID=A0A6G1KJ03_9PLEO|nr:PLC-like phosphodiesterase [Pleomassaria siparia CBS 279.74]
MGAGGFLTLLNGSPNDWTLGSQHSYQMEKWEWPTVTAGTAARVYVEFSDKSSGLLGGLFGGGKKGDDGGEAYYNIAGTPNTFKVSASKPDDGLLTITLDNSATKTSPQGSVIDLGFRHDGAVNWMMSTDMAGDLWSNSGETIDWMHQSMGSLTNRTLKQITMPGSHDAGMSQYNPGTIGANFANSQAQYLSVGDQLLMGSRYFDIRPVLSNGKWVAGHYSEVEKLGWVGGNGQSLVEMIQQINDFTAKYQELVIVNISHTLDTDNDFKDLNQDQWNQLFEALKGLNNRFTVTAPGTEDFSNKKLGDFITDRASVFVLNQLPGGISLGAYADQGFFNQDHFPLFDSYSESDDAGKMKADQIQKLKDNRNLVADAALRKDKFHIFSWTLTQGVEDVLNPDKAIMNLGVSVFDDLVFDAFNAFTPESFPNVLYVDSLGIRDKPVNIPFDKVSNVGKTADIAALAMAVNNAKAGRNAYITGV